MKLLTKITLFITLSKLAIVILFVSLLPFLVEGIASEYTNYYLRQQKKKVLQVVERNGVEYYLQGEDSYGSYTMLMEEYIALEPIKNKGPVDTIINARRIIESDTLHYRVLIHQFRAGNGFYLLEIGKTLSSIEQYNRPLQRVALSVLTILIALTILLDLFFTRRLLKPLGRIISSRLQNRKYPFHVTGPPIETSTEDFRYLDDSLRSLLNQINDAFEKEREFTSNASHELMTPISILQTKVENLMLEDGLTDEHFQRLAEMANTITRLKKIVQSLLLIARIENDQYSRQDTVLPEHLIQEVAEELSHRMEEKGIRFRADFGGQTRISSVNRDLLFQLFYNLVNNAIRYNKKGGEIKVREQMGNGSDYSIIVEDSGIGIPEKDLAQIFHRFKKFHKGPEENYGLGLSIVRSILSFHELDIRVESEEGKGTKVIVLFPAALISGNKKVIKKDRKR